MPNPSQNQTNRELILFAIARTIQNTGYRLLYPFTVALSIGVGVDVAAISRIAAVRALFGFASPLFGLVGDRWGRRVAMLIGMGLFSSGLMLVVFSPTYPALFASILLASIGKYFFDPAMQAYVGDRIPYEERGRAIAITELGWSGAFLLGMPLIGFLIAKVGWVSPFPLLAILGLIAGLIMWRTLPPSRPQSILYPEPTSSPSEKNVFGNLGLVFGHRPALMGMMVGLLISLANEVIFIIYGVWMAKTFGLIVTAIGISAIVIGFAELGGETLVATLADRIGKKRAVGIGIGVNIFAVLLLPLISTRVEFALAGLFFFFISFEFALVTSVSLVTELQPKARATLMSSNVAMLSAGRFIGAWIGLPLFALGLGVSSIISAIFSGIALLLLIAFVKVGESEK